MTVQNNRRILVAMSGGVDSSTAAYLLREQGYLPEGVTFKLWCHGKDDHYQKILERARTICKKLDIKHHVLDIEKEFREIVVQQFVNDYLSGITPNPCVFCNRTVKWRYLTVTADRLGIPFVATGHYARIEFSPDDRRYEIWKGVDPHKDQSYMLWQLPQEALRRTILPLGDRLKSEIIKIADDLDLHDENRKESQDICFLPGGNYREFLKSHSPERIAEISRGELVDQNLNVLGYHNGYHNFTIGQRKGFKMGFANRKYVREIDARNNRVMITDNDQLYSKEMIINNINWVSNEPQTSIHGTIKIRYNHRGVGCTVDAMNGEKYRVRFDEDQRAVTPGQSAVLYQDERLILGGTIVNDSNV